MTWILAGGGVAFVWWLLTPAKPIYYDGKHQADVPSFIQSVFMMLREGAVIHMVHEGSNARIRLRKIRLSNNELGLRVELPSTPDNSARVEEVKGQLAKGTFALEASAAMERLWPASDAPLLTVSNLNQLDAFRAVEATRLGLGLDQTATYTMHIEGIPSIAAVKEYAKRSRRAS